jgi:hypothetical protein
MKKNTLFILFVTLPLIIWGQKAAVRNLQSDFFDEDWKKVFSLPEHHFVSIMSSRNSIGFLVQSPENESIQSKAFTVFDEDKESFYIIDGFGKKIKDFGQKYYYITCFHNDIAVGYRAMKEKHNSYMLVFINSSGEVICNGNEYWEANFFEDGLAKVQLKDEKGDWCFINQEGKIQINISAYETLTSKASIGSFRKGNAILTIQNFKDNSKSEFTESFTYLIDKNGKKIFDFEKEFPVFKEKCNRSAYNNSLDYSIKRDETSGCFVLAYRKPNTKDKVEAMILDENLKTVLVTDWDGFTNKDNRLNCSSRVTLENKFIVKNYSYYNRFTKIRRDSTAIFDLNNKLVFTDDYVFGRVFSEQILLLIHQNDPRNNFVRIFDVKKNTVTSTFAGEGELISDKYLKMKQPIVGVIGQLFYNVDHERILDSNFEIVYETPKENLQYRLEKSNLEMREVITKDDIYWANFYYKAMNFIGDFKNIKRLELTCNEDTNLPESLGDLNQLEVLKIENQEDYGIKKLPDSFKNLKNLKELTLSAGQFSNLVESLKALPNLKIVNIEVSGGLEEYPVYKKKLQNLAKQFPKIKVNIHQKDVVPFVSEDEG